MFGLTNLMSMFSQDVEDEPEIDRHQNRRRRLVGMVRRSETQQASTIEPGTDPSRREEAVRFVAIANRRLGLVDLGIDASFSRPHTSNDNPYSESQFKTLKYRPDFPARFDSIEHARAFCQRSSPGTTVSIAIPG